MYRHLNLENAWPGVLLDHLVNDGGGLRLETTGSPSPDTDARLDSASLAGLARVGTDRDGNVYIPDPDNHRVLLWRACDGKLCPIRALGEGSSPGQLRAPRGVAVGRRGGLYIADSGNHRIQVVDLATLQVRAIQGQPDPYGEPSPGSAAGRLNDPWDVAVDATDCAYVTDHGNRRVQKFDDEGEPVTAFWETLRVQPAVPGEPAFVAAVRIDERERVLVIDRAPARVLVYDTGGVFDAVATRRWEALSADLSAGIVSIPVFSAPGESVIVNVLAFDATGALIDCVRAYRGKPAGLTVDRRGYLTVEPIVGGTAASTVAGLRYAGSGSFVAGPFGGGAVPTRWQRIRVARDELPPNAHLQLFTCTGASDAPPPPIASAPLSPGPVIVGPGVWRAGPIDSDDFLVLHEPARVLWVGGVFHGDERSSAVVRQIRLDYDTDGWMRHLPSIYGRDPGKSAFLERSLALFECLLGRVEQEIDDLPRLLDSRAAPDDRRGPWLQWLADGLAFELDDTWASTQRREGLEGAFALLGRRGTVEGLRQMVSRYAGIDANIEEPARLAGFWLLGTERSALGFTTQLANAQAQGAVLGTTAGLGESHLIRETEYGAPLFADVGHRFCVRVRSADVAAPGKLAALRRVLDREKPAHTAYQLCVLEPRLRVGVQARLGVDSALGRPGSGLALDRGNRLGVDASLRASERDERTVLGAGGRIGGKARLV